MDFARKIRGGLDIEKQNRYVIYQKLLWFIAIFVLIFVYLFQKNTEVICFIMLLFFQLFLTGFCVKTYMDTTTEFSDIFTRLTWLGLISAGLFNILAVFIFVIFYVDRYVKYGNEPPELDKTYKETGYAEQLQLMKTLLITTFAGFILTFAFLIAGNMAIVTVPIIVYLLGASAYEVYIASRFTRFISRRPIQIND